MINLNLLRQKNLFDQYGMDDGSGDLPGYMPDFYDESQPQNQVIPTPPMRRNPEMPPQIPKPPNIPDYSATPNQSQNEYDQLMKVYDKLYTPQHTATDRLNQFLSAFPNEDQYQPSIARRIVASGLALGGERGALASQKFLDEPYQTELEKWKAQAGPLQQAATLENQQNINERTLAGNFATAMTAQRRTDETARANQAKEDIARQKNEIAWAKSQGAKFDTKGAHVIITWPDGTVQDSGVPTTAFSPIEQQALRNEGAANVADIRAKSSAANVQAGKATTVVDSQGNIYTINPVTPDKPPVPMGGAPPVPVGPLSKLPTEAPTKTKTPAEIEKERVNMANAILASHPDLKPYITVSGTPATVTVKEPTPGLFTGVSAETQRKYKAAVSAIYGSNDPIKPMVIGQPSGQTQRAPSNQPGPVGNPEDMKTQYSPSNPGHVRVSTDGGKTWVYSTDGGKTWSRTPPAGGGE